MSRLALASIAALALVLAGACDKAGPAEDFPTGLHPSAALFYGTVCAQNHDFAPAFELIVNGCPDAEAGGYQDEAATFQYRFAPGFRAVADQQVLATYEYRYLSGGQLGIRLVDAVFFSVAGGSIAQTNPFPLLYIRELGGSKFIGYVSGCSSQYTDATQCWNNRTGGIHLEPRVCVDDPNDGNYGDADALCADVADDLASRSLNLLPTASFTFQQISEGFKQCFVGCYRFDARSSSDPEGRPLTYYWEFSDGVTALTTDPIYERYFMPGGGRVTARLRVDDGSGGIDIQIQSFWT